MQVNGYPADKLDEALEGVKVVVIPAGVPRKVCTLYHSCVSRTNFTSRVAAWCK